MPFPEELFPCLLWEIADISMGPGGGFDDDFKLDVFNGGGGGAAGLFLGGIGGGAGGRTAGLFFSGIGGGGGGEGLFIFGVAEKEVEDDGVVGEMGGGGVDG